MSVEEHGDEYRRPGALEFQVNGRHDRVKAGEQCPRSE
jgi:hypothetical protein